MKRIPSLTLVLFLVLAFAPPAEARAPQKPALMTYSQLWKNSPFTTKPIIEKDPGEEEANPFEDWALGGVSSVGGKYLVVLFNRKEAGKQKIIDQSNKESEFRIVSVSQDPDDYKKTVVMLTSGGQKGTVTYDDKVLATRGAAAAKNRAAQARVQAQQNKLPPGIRPPTSGSARPPRMRVIPPTNSGQTPSSRPPTGTSSRPPTGTSSRPSYRSSSHRGSHGDRRR